MGPFPLPTDNLYKFCAFVGVVMIGLCLYRSFNLKHEYAIREIELGAATQRADLEKTALQRLLDEVGAGTPAQRDSEALKNKQREAERLVKEYTLRNIEVISLTKQLTLIVKDRIELLFEFLIAFIAGGFLCVYGFANWRKLQQQQDKLLAPRLRRKKLNVTDPPIITVFGKTFFDIGHAPKDQSNRRKYLPGYAVWEIHPVMKLETL